MMGPTRHWALLALAPVALVETRVLAKDYLTVEAAQKLLFAGADRFAALPVKLDEAQIARIKALSGKVQRNRTPAIWRAQAGGKSLGLVIVDEVLGKHENITYAVGVSPDGKVVGVEILSYREAYGGEVRLPAWRAQFDGKTLASPFKLDGDIANISGATLSCRNLTDGVRRLLALASVVPA